MSGFHFFLLSVDAYSTCRNADVLDITVPRFCLIATPQTPQDWNYTTTPQPGLDGRAIGYPRGFGLGGSSAVSEFFGMHLIAHY